MCTTVAIAIVAETCSPFTVLPGLMNEYRVPELNVQNGVLKSLCFMFEYIGEMSKDYIYAVSPLLEDALMDRFVLHVQQWIFHILSLIIYCIVVGCIAGIWCIGRRRWRPSSTWRWVCSGSGARTRSRIS